MGFAIFPAPIKTWTWKDLHKKAVMIHYAPPNPECLEFEGYIYFTDKDGVTYVLEEPATKDQE